jgi:hypothetical protein
MSSIIVEVAAGSEPLSLADVKAQLRLGPWDDSDHITSALESTRLRGLIIAAREYCETFTRRSFVTKSYVQYLDSFPYYTDTIISQQAYPPAYYSLPRYSTTLWNYSQMIKILRSPVIDVHHINYVASDSGQVKSLQIGYPMWFAFETYALNAIIRDGNGNQQICITAGVTGAAAPIWATTPTATTADGSVGWMCGAAAPQPDYILDNSNQPGRIFPRAGQYWPPCIYVPRAVQIHFTAGFGDASKVPGAIKVAMRLLISLWNKDVTMQNQKLQAVDKLLWSERVEDWAPTRG